MAGCFTACSTNTVSAAEENKNLQIVTTIFPEYDWVMNILGDNPAGAEVTMLLDNGTDLHSYQPSAADILKISTCDVFVYVGGESDEWVDDVLKEAMSTITNMRMRATITSTTTKKAKSNTMSTFGSHLRMLPFLSQALLTQSKKQMLPMRKHTALMLQLISASSMHSIKNIPTW